MELVEFKEFVDNSPIPIVIATPLFGKSEEEILDFKILYVNKIFDEKFNNLLNVGGLFSESSDRLSLEDQLVESARICYRTKKTTNDTFYSTAFSCWIKAVMKPTSTKNIRVYIFDVTQEKEHEQQLKRQNLRLAALTDELSVSRENLRAKLKNIENLNKKLEFTAYHDTLTGLGNKDKLINDIELYKKESISTGKSFGVMLLGINNMKYINDSEGHSAGDKYICRAADILRRFEREDIKIFRFDGDEFIVLAKNLFSKNTLLNIGDAVLEAFNAEGIKFSAGISIFPDDTKDTDELLKFSDMAMGEVKKNERNNVRFFEQEMHQRFVDKFKIQTKMADAIANNEFQLYYQPQFDIATNKLRGFEALLRWYDKTLGWVSPAQFISIAEESRLIEELGDWVISTAMATLKKWTEQLGFKAIMNVNVSPLQLKEKDFITKLKAKIDKYGVSPENLEIEITEGVLIENKEEVVEILKRIRAMNIGISLDDFGTGYSSLNYLTILPITTLKIDKSFIENITSPDGIEANITDSIISMVTKMGLDTIAEGVETDEQLKILSDIKCRTMQGFLKGRPMPEAQCEELIAHMNEETA